METNELPEYDQDNQFDEDLDYIEIEYTIYFMWSFIGAGLSALFLAIYYTIINF